MKMRTICQIAGAIVALAGSIWLNGQIDPAKGELATNAMLIAQPLFLITAVGLGVVTTTRSKTKSRSQHPNPRWISILRLYAMGLAVWGAVSFLIAGGDWVGDRVRRDALEQSSHIVEIHTAMILLGVIILSIFIPAVVREE